MRLNIKNIMAATALTLATITPSAFAMDIKPEPHQHNLKVLSLDGGGIRGVIPVTQCAVLERLMKKPINQLVDVLGGTSTGGVLAAAFSYGIPADDLLMLYTKCGREIFKKETSNHLNYKGVYNTQYSAEPLIKIFKTLLEKPGQNTQCMFKTNEELEGTNLKIRTLLTGYCMTEAKNVLADSNNKDWQVNELWKLLRMTSAAPTFFDPMTVSFSQSEITGCIDGGLYANDPAHEITQFLIAENIQQIKKGAKKIQHPLVVLSLGTGKLKEITSPDDVQNRSALALAPQIIGTLFNSNAQSVPNSMRMMLERESFDEPNRLFLSKYVRIQPELADKLSSEMDNTTATNISILLGRGFDMVKTAEFKELLVCLDYQSQGDIDAEIEKVVQDIKINLSTINILNTSYLQLVSVINDYILEEDSSKRAIFFEALKIKNPSDDYLANLSQWIKEMRKANTTHDGEKSVSSKMWSILTNGKHAEISTAMDKLEQYCNKRGIV